jgi:pimeloyl-ACP methyl ester carboxylesterase
VSETSTVDNGDVSLSVTVTGEGPTILCVHGWPELAHSWRHQVTFLAARGWRVAAMDVRGYGASSVPAGVERYTLRELAGDVAAVAAALDDEPVVVLGHDWGAPIAWHAAIRHPDRVRAVAGLSVPHSPPMPVSLVDLFDGWYPERFFYMLHFQEPGVAEAEFGVDLRGGLKRVFHALSGAAPINALLAAGPRGTPLLSQLPDPPEEPLSFLDDDDLDVYEAAFRRTGMTGALNRYRAMPLDVESSKDILGATVDQPSCFIAGERDPVRALVPGSDGFADPAVGAPTSGAPPSFPKPATGFSRRPPTR